MARHLRRSLWLSAILFCTLLSAAQPPAPSSAPSSGSTNPRHFDAGQLGTRVALGPVWLFSLHDNPAFAWPAFDDSGWQILSTGKPLLPVDLRDSHYAWYRLHAHITPMTRDIAVEVESIEGSYELYVNGIRIGTNGNMSGPPEFSQGYLTAYDIPGRAITHNGDLVIAIRIALNRTGPQGLGTTTPLQTDSIFLASRGEVRRDASYEGSHQIAPSLMLCGLTLVVGFVALALYLAMRSRVEYLAIAISLLVNSLQMALIVWSHLHGFPAQVSLLQTLALSTESVALVEFVRLILHLRPSRWLLALEICLFLGYFSPNLGALGLLSPVPNFIGYFLPVLIVLTLLPVLLLRGLLRGNRDTYVVLPVIAVISVANYWNALGAFTAVFHLPLDIPALPHLLIGSYEIDFWTTWYAIYCVTMLLFLVLRTIGIVHERARAAGELEAARTVQQVLIPEEIPLIPGFALESVYRPAGEVGGDFFQILPIKHGGVLLVIGDVSGKGMPAAMTVSLLVGTFRTLAHYTQNPGEILAAMNTRMLARSHGGFTTCLVLRADRDGTLTVANAGHLAPYLAGKELPLENGLPLGLSATTSYSESTFHLAPGQQLTLVTDGVVEARDKTGALFGFERTAGLSLQPAETIAHAAQAFGQEDDITALTLMATAPRQPALA
ncbi:MAG TPA: PP2C family protein-serine/threonine phosphatase [Terracidiphilus sp.]|nr:PP2C family protein-serine/threonine phosphatase [Terracidiphilus sp.]